jgi:hypothetical protein
MAVSSLASMTAPILCGFLGQRFGMVILPFYLLLFFAVMVSFGLLANKVLWKTHGRR